MFKVFLFIGTNRVSACQQDCQVKGKANRNIGFFLFYF